MPSTWVSCSTCVSFSLGQEQKDSVFFPSLFPPNLLIMVGEKRKGRKEVRNRREDSKEGESRENSEINHAPLHLRKLWWLRDLVAWLLDNQNLNSTLDSVNSVE